MSRKQDVKAVVARVLQLDAASVTETLSRDTVASWDSFNNILLFSELERSVGVRFSMQEVAAAKGMPDILRYLAEKGLDVRG